MATLNIRDVGKLSLNKGVTLEDALKQIKKQIALKKALKSKVEPLKTKRSKYIELLEITESSDKKSIVFNFKNNSQFSYNLIDKKIQNLQGKLSDIEIFESQKLDTFSDSFYRKLIDCSKEKWIRTFFKICSSYNNDKSSGDKPLFLASKVIADKIEIISKVQNFQDLEEYSFLDSLINSRKFKTSLKDIGLDNWFLENFIQDNRLWHYLEEYNSSKSQNKVELFRYCWENYKLGRFRPFVHWTKTLIEKGYEEKRLADYLCKEVVTQGLRPFVQENLSEVDYYEDGDEYNDHIDFCDTGLMYSRSSLDLLITYVNLQEENVYEKFPKHLKTEVDRSTYKRNLKKDKVLEKEYEKIYHSLKMFEFEDENYCVLVPKTPKEVVSEGVILEHCVADYAKDVAIGRSKIFFIRLKNKPEKPLLTMQVYGKTNFKISMVRGKRNRYVNEKEELFLDKYKKYLKSIKLV